MNEGLVAEGLVKRYDEVLALDEFDLTARPGEIVGLVGANGAGSRRQLGFAPQEIALYFSATVRENLRLFGGLVGLRRASLRNAIAEAAECMHLEAVLDRPVGLLSGGQRRRAHVASALLSTPAVLLLDEPTAGADPPTRQALLEAVRDRAAAGAAVVYTTHYLPELAELDATLAVIKHGRVIARGDQDRVLAGLPGEVRVRFDGSVPERLRGRGDLVDGELRLPTTDPAQTLAGLLSDGHVPVSVDVRRPSLDDLYRSLETVAHAT